MWIKIVIYIYKIYNKFEKNLNLNNNFTVAVSGGADSLALAFFSKIFSIKKSLKVKYFIVDHKLRTNSSVEALFVKNFLSMEMLILIIVLFVSAILSAIFIPNDKVSNHAKDSDV